MREGVYEKRGGGEGEDGVRGERGKWGGGRRGKRKGEVEGGFKRLVFASLRGVGGN